jgi:hypothetical protein
MENQWSDVNVPIWVIQGLDDDLVDPKNVMYAKSMFSNKDAKFIEVEDSGHLIVDSILDALNTRLSFSICSSAKFLFIIAPCKRRERPLAIGHLSEFR